MLLELRVQTQQFTWLLHITYFKNTAMLFLASTVGGGGKGGWLNFIFSADRQAALTE